MLDEKFLQNTYADLKIMECENNLAAIFHLILTWSLSECTLESFHNKSFNDIKSIIPVSKLIYYNSEHFLNIHIRQFPLMYES